MSSSENDHLSVNQNRHLSFWVVVMMSLAVAAVLTFAYFLLTEEVIDNTTQDFSEVQTDDPEEAEATVSLGDNGLTLDQKESATEALLETFELYRSAETEEIRSHLNFIYTHTTPEMIDLILAQPGTEIESLVNDYLSQAESITRSDILDSATAWRQAGDLVEISLERAGERRVFFVAFIDGQWYGL